ncbi:signal transduction histidine kinase [Tamaricihabitans halophyticus]|uniref:histidine kinase n=1 Tax=Tamaricihabitans halophyticus TaxID=1262583 RepID=A0A4R2Q4W9_9PSEU|nr:sensor histidine kinase [Tamaricihabitans halophyticus]TCP43647.1 signal transduction histidine kinase [Tamaricihabitans halophyticus]
MNTRPAEQNSPAQPRNGGKDYPSSFRTLAYFLLGFPLSLVSFILVVVLIIVGVATTVVWVGIPIFVFGISVARWLGNVQRNWANFALGTNIPLPPRLRADDGLLRQWRTLTTDSRTWRDIGYHALMLPLSIIEFALGLVGAILLPLAIWVIPRLGWLHGQLAKAMLGPPAAAQLAAKADRLQASRARGVDAAEAERRRIERDLHDGAQQRLVSLAISLGRAKAKLEGDPNAVRELIDEAHTDAKLAVAELRDLARGIYPAVLGDRGLDAALSSLAAKSPVPVEVTVDVEPRPPAAVESTAYFIVGETLTNVAKHSGATVAQIRVWREDDKVVAEVSDNGKGGAEVRPGGGLAGLADRAATIDGVVTVVSPTAGPTVVRADLPCTW